MLRKIILIISANQMIPARILFGRRISHALFGFQMQNHAFALILRLIQKIFYRIEVVSVRGPEIKQTEFLKITAAEQRILKHFFGVAQCRKHCVSNQRNRPYKPRRPFFEIDIALGRTDMRDMMRKRADVFGNRHFILIEDDNQPQIRITVVQRFMDKPARKRAVT